MADILTFETPAEAFYKRLALRQPERPTQDIIDDLKPLRMTGVEDAFARNILFAELAVKAERNDS